MSHTQCGRCWLDAWSNISEASKIISVVVCAIGGIGLAIYGLGRTVDAYVLNCCVDIPLLLRDCHFSLGLLLVLWPFYRIGLFILLREFDWGVQIYLPLNLGLFAILHGAMILDVERYWWIKLFLQDLLAALASVVILISSDLIAMYWRSFADPVHGPALPNGQTERM
jgi:hypothetical protein